MTFKPKKPANKRYHNSRCIHHKGYAVKVKIITFHAGKAYKRAILSEGKLSEMVRIYRYGRDKGFKYSDDLILEFFSHLTPEERELIEDCEKSKEWFVRAWDEKGELLAEGWIHSSDDALKNMKRLQKAPKKEKGYWQLESKVWQNIRTR